MISDTRLGSVRSQWLVLVTGYGGVTKQRVIYIQKRNREIPRDGLYDLGEGLRGKIEWERDDCNKSLI